MDTQLIISAVATFIISSVLACAGDIVPGAPKSFKAADSKYLQSEGKAKWIAEMRTQLRITKQKNGPFGLSQDLSVKRITKATPKEVRMIMIDPKVVELTSYVDTPHLLTPVIIDMNLAASALRWSVNEIP